MATATAMAALANQVPDIPAKTLRGHQGPVRAVRFNGTLFKESILQMHPTNKHYMLTFRMVTILMLTLLTFLLFLRQW